MFATLTTLAQDYTYTYTSPTDTEASAGIPVVVLLGILIAAALSIAGMWNVFTKAGKPGWAALVPIYNILVILQIVGRPWWWILFSLVGIVPFVGWIVSLAVSIIIAHDLSKSFGKGAGMTVLQLLLPFVAYPILGFGDAAYRGPSAANGGGSTGPAAPTHTAHPAA